MTCLRSAFLLVPAIGFLLSGGNLPAQQRRDDPAADQAPTADAFYLKVESLIDNVADLDVRRFTIVAQEGKVFKFHIGGGGMASKGHRTTDDPPGVRRLEAIVLLHLHGSEAQDTKIRRTMKFHRTRGSSIDTNFDAPGRESLKDVVKIAIKSGRYPVGTPLVVGTVNGANVVVAVE
jgi:hypothetical protein